jgi:hypothetical protein
MSDDSEHDLTNPRTQAMLHRLHTAMKAIEAEIDSHNGIYPFNHGRVTQSELCRRADVKKATLQTRVATRHRITAETDNLSVELQRLRAELALAQQKIELLELENASLRTRLGVS